MRFQHAPMPLLQLIATILLAPSVTRANPHPMTSAFAGFSYNDLFARWECGGELCGWQKTLCCAPGSCYTNTVKDWAECYTTESVEYGSTSAGAGHWQYYTTTYTETDLQTITSVMSSYVTASASAGSCNYAIREKSCGSTCCGADEECESGQCIPIEGGSSSDYSSAYAASATPGAPVRGTSSAAVVVTQTASPTTTVPFVTPVATGANITITGQSHSSSGLSGGAIAGIVIGVLVGLFLLGLLCFYCCIKGILDGCLAIFGLGGRRKKTEVEEYERRSHYDSRGGRRTWYGAPRPARSERREKEESHVGRNLLGIGAGLGALWAILGLKRRSNQRREEERYSEYSERTYESDYYTSASSASSGDRRTRVTRDTRRSVSRR